MSPSKDQNSPKNAGLGINIQNYTNFDQLLPQLKQQLQQGFGAMSGKDWMNFLKYGTYAQKKGENFSGIMEAFSGLSSQAKEKSLKYIMTHLPDSMAQKLNLKEGQDSLSPPYKASSEKFPLTPPPTPVIPTRKINAPLDPLKASKTGERFRIFVVIVGLLVLAWFLGREWIMEQLAVFIGIDDF